MAKKKTEGTKDKTSIHELKLKKAEALLKRYEADLKNLEVIEKAIDIDEKREKTKITKVDTQMDRINCLSNVLSSFLIDDENATIGSEMKFKNAFNEGEQTVIKNKLLKMINEL